MKNYVKAQVVAKNSPEGSYAAGCPTGGSSNGNTVRCKACDRAV